MTTEVSKTEFEIARRIHQGLSYKRIASEIGLAGANSVSARVHELAKRLHGPGSAKFRVLRTPFPDGFTVRTPQDVHMRT